jgi:riboflavin-specific deaminase-like protein
MRRLLPEPAPVVNEVAAYAPPVKSDGDRPFVRCNMISSLDGAVALNGRSGQLGGPADRRVFQLLRSVTDIVLVGAGTVRAERYGPARLDEQMRDLRRERAQTPVPPIAVVTRSAQLDWTSPFFTEAEARPIVFVTRECDLATRRRGEEVADFVQAGDVRVDPRLVLRHLHQAGYRSVLLEGGPALNGDVLAAGLLDEVCLTLSPRLVGGTGPRVLAGADFSGPLHLRTVHLLEEDGFLFYRLAVLRDRAHG